MKTTKKMFFSIILIFLLIGPSIILIGATSQSTLYEDDFDPLVNIEITVEILKIRSLEKKDPQIGFEERIDRYSDPDFFVKVFINDEVFKSPIWRNEKYIYDPQWSATLDVPDDVEFVDIKIQLWDWNLGLNRLCDISAAYSDMGFRDSRDVELSYSIATGHWIGDDASGASTWNGDVSGYGRLNGCDDGSIYERDRDCELWFDIYQTDPDGDGIPYWSEVNYHGTDPIVDNSGMDSDEDGIPIEWEDKWGHLMWHWHGDNETYHYWIYDDMTWNDHENIDPDNDGLNNYEEYLTSEWESDPYRDDIFVEMDRMADSPNGFETNLPDGSKELLRTAFNRRNIIYHLDDGSMGGLDIIPFEEEVNRDRCVDFYNDYFLHGDEKHWRKGIFHYGLVVYQAEDGNGYLVTSDIYQISANGMETKVILKSQKHRDIVYASAYMHEFGHTLGFSPIGGHDLESYYPWQIGWWKWRPYRSCMNYGYMYTTVDYSDGSRGRNDFDDWERLDLTWFQPD